MKLLVSAVCFHKEWFYASSSRPKVPECSRLSNRIYFLLREDAPVRTTACCSASERGGVCALRSARTRRARHVRCLPPCGPAGVSTRWVGDEFNRLPRSASVPVPCRSTGRVSLPPGFRDKPPERKSRTWDSFWTCKKTQPGHQSAQLPAQELWLLLAAGQKSKNIQGSTSPR